MWRYMDEDRVIHFQGPTSAAPRFVAAPRLRWSPIPKAVVYKVLVATTEQLVWTGEVTDPAVELTDVWERVGPGQLDVLVKALDGAGREVAVRGHRRFWRVPGFDGRPQELLDWRAAARASIAHLLGAAKDETRAYEGDLPRWIWSSFEDTPSGTRSQLAYPAQHLPSFITCFLLFAATESADPLAGQAIEQAVRCGDWLLDHRLPAGWACGGMPLSTIEQGELRGGLEGQAITLFRSARVGEAMLELADATGDERYARYAEQIADRLRQTQRGDGSWPHRIDPETGRVVSTYSSSAITPVLLFASLAERGLGAYEQPRLAAERWLEDNPLRTGRWEGMYEDIPAGGEAFSNLQHWDVNETIRYLVHGKPSISDPLRRAVELNDFIEDQFVVWQPEVSPVLERCPTPTVLEQYRCLHPMEVHTGHWLLSLLALHHATGEEHYLAKGIAAANSIVRGQWPNGAFSTWGKDVRFGEPLLPFDWPGCNAGATTALLRWAAYYDACRRGLPAVPGRGGI